MTRKFILVGSIVVLAVAGVVYWMNSSGNGGSDKPAEDSRFGRQDSGGNSNNKTGGEALADKSEDKEDPRNVAYREKRNKELDYGRVQPVSSKDNPAAESILEAQKSGKHTERLGLFAMEKKFDKSLMLPKNAEAYKKYLSLHVPTRVYQIAQPGKDVPILRVVGKRFYKVKPGDTVTLSVAAAPNAPVTFTSNDLGSFSNGFTSVTVKADSRGLAQAEFTATKGASFDCRIKVGCPLTAENQDFIVNIHKQN